MGDIEEIVKHKYLIVDTWDVKHQHMLIAGFTLLTLVTYSIFLWFICSLKPNFVATLFLLGSQIALGLPATRAYYDFGISSRKMLKFYDIGVLDSDSEAEDFSIDIEDVSLFFEKIGLQLEKYDRGSLDDINDLAWFSIIVWAIISSLFFYQEFHVLAICPVGAVILAISCLASYYNGFRTFQGYSFEECFSHLQFYIEKHVQYINSILPSVKGAIFLRIAKRGTNYVFVDIITEFKPQENTTLEYHIGLGFGQNERFILNSSPTIIEQFYKSMKELEPIKKSTWILEQMTTPSGRILRVINQQKAINITEMRSIIMSPSIVDKTAAEAGEILKQMVKILSVVST